MDSIDIPACRAIQEDRRARDKAKADMDNEKIVRDFMNPNIDTNPYRREHEARMAEAYNEERLLLIEEWSRINGH